MADDKKNTDLWGNKISYGSNGETYRSYKNLAWGCGYGSRGLSNTCDNKSAPCRLAPASILGYK